MKKIFLSLIIVILFSLYFIPKSNENSYDISLIREKMPSKIIRLTKSLWGTLRYEIKDHNISDEEFIKEATKQDPSLIEPFQNYALLIKRTKRNLILMVGPKTKDYCMFQDYSWSDNLDFNYLKSGEKIPFEITAEVSLN